MKRKTQPRQNKVVKSKDVTGPDRKLEAALAVVLSTAEGRFLFRALRDHCGFSLKAVKRTAEGINSLDTLEASVKRDVFFSIARLLSKDDLYLLTEQTEQSEV